MIEFRSDWTSTNVRSLLLCILSNCLFLIANEYVMNSYNMSTFLSNLCSHHNIRQLLSRYDVCFLSVIKTEAGTYMFKFI